MLDRFTETAKRLISNAREKAEQRNHNRLSNEHLLEAFLNESSCFAYRLIMENIPFTDFIAREIQSRLNSFPVENDNTLNFDEYCKKSFERAFMLTEKLGHHGISTGSLLLGMLQSEAPRTAPMLRSWGLSLKVIVQRINEMGDPGEDETSLSTLSGSIARQLNRMNSISEDAQRIISHAQELAKSCNTSEINTSHFLLSFVFLASRNVIDVNPLDATTFDLNKVKESVVKNLTGQIPFSNEQLLFDFSLHKVLRIAAVEAYQFGRPEITPVEIALGLLLVMPDEAAAGFGGDYFALRWSIIDLLGDSATNANVQKASSTGIPRISLRRYNADQSTVILIPEKSAREWQVMALDHHDDTLSVAMVDPFNHETIKKIEELTGMKVAPLKTDEKELNAAFRINY
ncbi:MAG: Clp protease N-terminal domain-containing protein [bacterium]